MGVLGHGFGHLILAFKPISTQTAYEVMADSNFGHVIFFSILFIFWYLLSKDTQKGFGNNGHLCFVLINSVLTYFFVRGVFGLAYVSAVICTAEAFTYMSMKKKTFYYNSGSLASMPIILVSYIEGLACDEILVHIGGHIWYDISIPFCLMAWFFYMKYDHTKT